MVISHKCRADPRPGTDLGPFFQLGALGPMNIDFHQQEVSDALLPASAKPGSLKAAFEWAHAVDLQRTISCVPLSSSGKEAFALSGPTT